jgi:hypothetical protein
MLRLHISLLGACPKITHSDRAPVYSEQHTPRFYVHAEAHCTGPWVLLLRPTVLRWWVVSNFGGSLTT